MAQKTIQELLLRSAFNDSCDVIADDGVDTKKVSGPQLRVGLRVRKTIATQLEGAGNFIVPALVEQVQISIAPTFAINPGDFSELGHGGSGAGAMTGSIKSSGAAWVWGYNFFGHLGDGTTANKSSPVAVIGGHSFVKLGAGDTNSIGLKSDGTLMAWGWNADGQVGDGTLTDRSSPVAVIGGRLFTHATCSTGNSVTALDLDGAAWCWGSNAFGRLGDGTILPRSSPTAVIGGHSFYKIDCARGLKRDGSVWGWGWNAQGDLGDGTIIHRSSPVAVIGGHSFISVTAGTQFTAALKADGSVWTWGRGDSGQLGHGTTVSRSSPVQVIGGHSFISISAADNAMFALKADGTAWAWGQNPDGRLGDGTIDSRSSPVQVIGGHSFVQLYGGASGGMGIKADGAAWCWGDNTFAGCGDGTTVDRSSPVAVIGGHVFATTRSTPSYAERKYTVPVTAGDSISYSPMHFGSLSFSVPQMLFISYMIAEES